LGSGTFDSGNTGDVFVVADTVNVSGASAANLPSLIATSMTGQTANSGRIELTARTLTLRESGLISTTSVGIGNAGNIDVTVLEEILIEGGLPGLSTSTIASTVDFPPTIYQQLLGLADTPEGNAGNVTITTPLLQLNDESTVTVANLSAGNAGDLTIYTDEVVWNSSAIDAFTRDGEGGSIEINANDIVFLSGSSKISTTALGNSGNGGNLTINSPIVFGVENSDILANAVTGDGGNIDITTQLLLGLTFREARTPESDITASSEFGLSGLFSVNGLSLDVDSGLVVLSTAVQDDSAMVANRCSTGEGNQFVVSGRGGFPTQPMDRVVSDRIWADFRNLGTERSLAGQRLNQLESEANIPAIYSEPLRAAGSWQRSMNGEVVLQAEGSRSVSMVVDCVDQ